MLIICNQKPKLKTPNKLHVSSLRRNLKQARYFTVNILDLQRLREHKRLLLSNQPHIPRSLCCARRRQLRYIGKICLLTMVLYAPKSRIKLSKETFRFKNRLLEQSQEDLTPRETFTEFRGVARCIGNFNSFTKITLQIKIGIFSKENNHFR